MMWSGDRLISTGMLICPRHMDVPNQQDRIIRLPPDPVPRVNPRPQIDLLDRRYVYPQNRLISQYGAPIFSDDGLILTDDEPSV
jgi:hypothetical protein